MKWRASLGLLQALHCCVPVLWSMEQEPHARAEKKRSLSPDHTNDDHLRVKKQKGDEVETAEIETSSEEDDLEWYEQPYYQRRYIWILQDFTSALRIARCCGEHGIGKKGRSSTDLYWFVAADDGGNFSANLCECREPYRKQYFVKEELEGSILQDSYIPLLWQCTSRMINSGLPFYWCKKSNPWKIKGASIRELDRAAVEMVAHKISEKTHIVLGYTDRTKAIELTHAYVEKARPCTLQRLTKKEWGLGDDLVGRIGEFLEPSFVDTMVWILFSELVVRKKKKRKRTLRGRVWQDESIAKKADRFSKIENET